MYTKPTQYPEMQGRTSSEQMQLLKISLKSHGKTMQFRFYIALTMVLFSCGIVGLMDGKFNFPSWLTFFAPIILGLIFYIYLIWEINGAVHVAVQNTIKQNSEKRV